MTSKQPPAEPTPMAMSICTHGNIAQHNAPCGCSVPLAEPSAEPTEAEREQARRDDENPHALSDAEMEEAQNRLLREYPLELLQSRSANMHRGLAVEQCALRNRAEARVRELTTANRVLARQVDAAEERVTALREAAGDVLRLNGEGQPFFDALERLAKVLEQPKENDRG